jgi:hypothetical protein
MRRAFSITIAVALTALLAAALVTRASDVKLPEGVVKFDTSSVKGNKADSGFPSTVAAVDKNYFWLGRQGGIRKYDRQTGKWDFYAYDGKICPGTGTMNLVAEPPYVWARLANTGFLCRFDPAGGPWFTMRDWTVLSHTGPGGPMVFTPDYIYVAEQDSPDWEGVNIVDRKKGKWVRLLPSKPVMSMLVEPRFLWLGVPEGILRINRITEEYTYYQPTDHGGGALVKEILPIPAGLAFATMGERTGILGDEMQVFKNSIRVHIKKEGKWHSYQRSERERLTQDLQNGTIFANSINTKPGLLILSGGKWRLLTTKNGLAADNITSIAKDDKYLYVGTAGGTTVLDLVTLRPRDINPQIRVVLLRPRRLISDTKYLWAITNHGLFRIAKSNLFSFPR